MNCYLYPCDREFIVLRLRKACNWVTNSNFCILIFTGLTSGQETARQRFLQGGGRGEAPTRATTREFCQRQNQVAKQHLRSEDCVRRVSKNHDLLCMRLRRLRPQGVPIPPTSVRSESPSVRRVFNSFLFV